MQHDRVTRWIVATATIVAVGIGAARGGAEVNGNAARQTEQPAAIPDELKEHIDEAEDLLESLLDWGRALTTTTPNPRETTAPTMSANTLMVVPESDVKKLVALIDTLSTRVPKPARPDSGPQGDLRAHVEKAQEIAREFQTTTNRSAGPATGAAALLVVDRTALERLEIEIDAMERVLPRSLSVRSGSADRSR